MYASYNVIGSRCEYLTGESRVEGHVSLGLTCGELLNIEEKRSFYPIYCWPLIRKNVKQNC